MPIKSDQHQMHPQTADQCPDVMNQGKEEIKSTG